MITKIVIRLMFAIAKMSKKASAIYLAVLTLLFCGAISFLLYGVIYLTNGNDVFPDRVVFILILGLVFFFFVVAMIALTTIASNYVRKNPDKNPKEIKKED